jgi:exonuclease III
MGLRILEWNINGRSGFSGTYAIPPFVAPEVLNKEADIILFNEFVLTVGWHGFKSIVEVEYELFASPYVSGQNGILIGLRKKVSGLDYNSIKIITDMNTEYERPNFLQVDFNYMNSHYSVIGVRTRVGFDKKSERVTTQLQAIYQHLLSLNPKSKIICTGDYNVFPRVLWKTTEIEGTMSDTLETQGFGICCPAYDGISDSFIRRKGDYIKWSFVHEDGAKSLLDHLIYLGVRIEKADYDWKFVTRENGYIKEGKNINAEDYKEFLNGYPDHAMLIVNLI